MGCCDVTSQLRAPIYILIILFAWASWIDINGLFVEVPLLVGRLPESWNLPSYMAIIIQIANIGPILFTVISRTAPPGKVKEWPFVYAIVGVGATSCMLLAFLWDRTTVIGGELHSTAFLSLTAFLALVDCTSSVVFLPYMAQFRPEYMTAYYIGEGLSGMIPGFVGLIQGVGSDPMCLNETVNGTNGTEYQILTVYDPPLFEVRAFFIFLFFMILISGGAFTLLHFLPYCQRERMSPSRSYDVGKDIDLQEDNFRVEFSPGDGDRKPPPTTEPPVFSENGVVSSKANLTAKEETDDLPAKRTLTTGQFVFSLVVIVWVNAILNGVLPSTQSFTCLPYGNLAYTLALRISTVANPLTCLVALFVRAKSLIAVGILTLVATILTGYQLYLAAESPFPPLKHETAGVALVIASSVLIAACIAYAKVSIALLLNDHGGQRALLWCGGMTQVGSCVGAIVIFLVINVGKVFLSEDFCTGAVY